MFTTKNEGNDAYGLLHEISKQPKVDPGPILLRTCVRTRISFTKDTAPCSRFKALGCHENLLPSVQGVGGVWHCGSWTNWFGHSGGIDAGLACARRLGVISLER